jgi:arylsulfatase A-like enzyme
MTGGLVLAIACGGSSGAAPPGPTPSAAPLANIVFILADDQDMQSMPYMPKLKTLLADQGVTFRQNFVTTSLCAPSRASLLTGKYGHNHMVRSNQLPQGGEEVFAAGGHESSNVATWLKTAGYRTILVGKYMNAYPTGSPTYVPPGWDDWHGDFAPTGEPDSGNYLNWILNDNGVLTRSSGRQDDYLTDVLTKRAVTAIQQAAAGTQPFFLYLAPPNPHTPALRPVRYAAVFGDLRAPRTPSFNEFDVSNKPAWLRDYQPFTDRDIRRLDELYRDRLASMLPVDDMIEQVVQALQAAGKLDNTYIVFNSDNGFLIGPHRFPHGKGAAFEESIRVPLVVRGPGVSQGQIHDALVLNIDMAPTFAAWARASAPDVDGRSFDVLLRGPTPADWRKDFLIEHWQNVSDPDDPSKLRGGIPTHAAVRTQTAKYVEYLTGETEYYDLVRDPFELDNVASSVAASAIQPLQARLPVLKSCRGSTCRN